MCVCVDSTYIGQHIIKVHRSLKLAHNNSTANTLSNITAYKRLYCFSSVTYSTAQYIANCKLLSVLKVNHIVFFFSSCNSPIMFHNPVILGERKLIKINKVQVSSENNH